MLLLEHGLLIRERGNYERICDCAQSSFSFQFVRTVVWNSVNECVRCAQLVMNMSSVDYS
jgi:hypothetical protein